MRYGVNDAVVIRDHTETIRQCDKVGLRSRKTEQTSVLANNFHMNPAKTYKSFPGNLAERRWQVHQIDSREESLDVEICLHCFDVPSCAASDVYPHRSLAGPRPSFFFISELSGNQSQHIFTPSKEPCSSHIVDICLSVWYRQSIANE